MNSRVDASVASRTTMMYNNVSLHYNDTFITPGYTHFEGNQSFVRLQSDMMPLLPTASPAFTFCANVRMIANITALFRFWRADGSPGLGFWTTLSTSYANIRVSLNLAVISESTALHTTYKGGWMFICIVFGGRLLLDFSMPEIFPS